MRKKKNLRSYLPTLLKLLIVFNVLCAFAQKPQNEFSINIGGGLKFFCPQPLMKGFSSVGYGYDAGVGFTGFFSPRFGIHTGVEVGFFEVNKSINHFIFTTKKDNCGFYDLHTTLNNYKETHKAISLSIPLMFQFQTKMGNLLKWRKNNKVGYYLMAGAKAQLLINYDYTSEIASFNNAAYYPEFDNWVHSYPILGLGVLEDISTSGKLKFGILPILAAETGTKWRIGRTIFLYTGIYFDYGLLEPTRKKRTNPDSFFLILSEKVNIESLVKYADKIEILSVGLRIRLVFLQPPKKEHCYCL